MKTSEQAELKENAIKFLRKHLKPGKKVYTILRHRSSSGMSRDISVAIVLRGEVSDISWYVAHAIGYKRNPDNGALKVSGCGMDMGFSVVYSLGRVLYPKGFKLPKGRYGRNGDTSGFDKDGGYALKQEWI